MCELLGLSFAQPISADFSMGEFATHDADNADGWGLAWYPDESLAMVKEPMKWEQSKHSGFLKSYQGLRSRIYIGHVRHKTTGSTPRHSDTHPFARELNGREYCFAHNGTIEGPYWELPLGRYHPVGTTDSEYLFCHLLEEIAARGAGWLDKPEGWVWLNEYLNELNKLGRINCLLSDGQRLFCYHDLGGWKGLAIRKVYIADAGTRTFGDPDLVVDLASAGVNHGFVIATRPLSPSGWHNFEPGELMVLAGGIVRLSSYNIHLFAVPSSSPMSAVEV